MFVLSKLRSSGKKKHTNKQYKFSLSLSTCLLFHKKVSKTSTLTFVFQVKTRCCHTNVRVKMQVKLIGCAIQQCWHSCTWKKKSCRINCSSYRKYCSFTSKRQNQDWIRQVHFLLIIFMEVSNILLYSALFSLEAARKFWLQVVILKGCVSMIKQDPIMFKWNFIDLDREKRFKQNLTMRTSSTAIDFFHMYEKLAVQNKAVQIFFSISTPHLLPQNYFNHLS